MDNVARARGQPADQRGGLRHHAGASGAISVGTPHVDAQMINAALEAMTAEQFSMMQNAMNGLQEVVGAPPSMSRAEAELRWQDHQAFSMNGGHRGPGSGAQSAPKVDDY